MLSLPVIIESTWYIHVSAAHLFNLKSHALMKGDGAEILRRGHRTDDDTAARPNGAKKLLVEMTTEAGFAVVGMDTNEMDVRFAGVALRNKTNQERDKFISVLDNEACFAKIYEE